MTNITKVLLLTILIPLITIAGMVPSEPCFTDSNGACVYPGLETGIGDDSGVQTQTWVGRWYDFSGTVYTVSASSFIACDTLLHEATDGTNYIVGECHRVN